MDDVPILGGSREERIFQQAIAMHGAPAFMRRAQQVEQVWEGLLDQCRRRRREKLEWAGLRLATLYALAADWDRLRPLLADDDQVGTVIALHEELQPRLRLPVEPTSSERQLRHALAELIDALHRFNEWWLAFVEEVDLTEVNRLREGYNRWYVVEKECAVRSSVVARQGFRPLAPATRDDLRAALPALMVPRADTTRG